MTDERTAGPVRALVTGLTGQDGGYLAERLVADGHVVHGIVSRPGELPGHLAALGDRLQIHQADLRHPQSVTDVIDRVEPDWLFNLGGLSSVAASWDDPVGTLDVN